LLGKRPEAAFRLFSFLAIALPRVGAERIAAKATRNTEYAAVTDVVLTRKMTATRLVRDTRREAGIGPVAI